MSLLSPPRPARRARFRPRRLLRRPIPWWVAAVLLTITTTVVVGRATGEAVAERARWGDERTVVVALADHEPGDALRAEVRRLPAAVVPDGALDALPSAATAITPLAAGEIVVARRIAPEGLSLVAARLPDGTRGVAVPHGIAPLPVEVDDRVDILATFETQTVRVGTDALVVDVGDDAVTVAVDADEAADVAYAVAVGVVTLALSGTSSRR